MATPTYPSKRYYASGTKRGTTWGTAVALGAGDGVLAKDDGGLALVQTYEQYEGIDQIMPMDGELSLIGPIEFAPRIDLQYEMGAWGRWLAALWGTAGTPQTLTTGVYKHTFQYADSVSHFFTFCQERPGKIWEVASAMPYKLNLKPDGSKIAAVLGLRGNTLIDDSTVNTATQIDALTYASRGNFVNFIHGSFLMNEQGGSALGSGDAVTISDFELNFERAIDAVHVLGSSVLAEPKEGAFPRNTLKITLPRATSTNMAYFSSFKSLTSYKAKLEFTGALISGSYYYKITFYLPRLRLQVAPDVKLEDIIKNEMTFEIEAASSAPSGMSYARPYIEVVNTQSTDYLA